MVLVLFEESVVRSISNTVTLHDCMMGQSISITRKRPYYGRMARKKKERKEEAVFEWCAYLEWVRTAYVDGPI